ncbi:MAG: class A beta-lactamase-related serine hydrolase, partial [Muribaculaceae bacterium]|nr:class A beta-lactamase-related serine hydrolase [Muribaculaceae bacterium]
MKHFSILLAALFFSLCGVSAPDLREEIEDYIKDKDARIGVAVIIDGVDTVSVNGDKAFPMLSVYKFPIALALGDYGRFGAKLLPDSVAITSADLKADTYSPMRDKYGEIDTINVALSELLAYSLQQSDNNASDIILGLLPFVGYVNHYLSRCKIYGINVANTEDEMHANPALCYENASTPLAMA